MANQQAVCLPSKTSLLRHLESALTVDFYERIYACTPCVHTDTLSTLMGPGKAIEEDTLSYHM